jgi:hypothetical protein
VLPTLAFVGLVTADRTLQSGIEDLGYARRITALTVSGMVSVVTAVLAGSTVGLLAVLLSGHSLVAAVCCGVVVGIVVLAAMIRYQRLAWDRALAEPLIIGDPAGSQ